MEVATPGQGAANGHTPPPPASASIDPDLVVRHLVDLLEITLGASTEDLKRKGSLLSEARKSDTVQRCTRFASESQVALYVQKTIITTELPNGAVNGHISLGIFDYRAIKGTLLTSTPRSYAPLPLFAPDRDLLLTHDCCFGSPHQTATTH
jgi:dynein heavy chain 1